MAKHLYMYMCLHIHNRHLILQMHMCGSCHHQELENLKEWISQEKAERQAEATTAGWAWQLPWSPSQGLALAARHLLVTTSL